MRNPSHELHAVCDAAQRIITGFRELDQREPEPDGSLRDVAFRVRRWKDAVEITTLR